MTRYNPVKYLQVGGSTLGAMKPLEEGRWVEFKEAEKLLLALEECRAVVFRD